MLCDNDLNGKKITVTLTILKTNHRAFQISYLRLSHFPLQNKTTFFAQRDYKFKIKNNNYAFGFYKIRKFFLQIKNGSFSKDLCYWTKFNCELLLQKFLLQRFLPRRNQFSDKLIFQRVLHTESKVLVTYNTAYFCQHGAQVRVQNTLWLITIMQKLQVWKKYCQIFKFFYAICIVSSLGTGNWSSDSCLTLQQLFNLV